MRTSIFGALIFVSMTASAVARACPVGGDDGVPVRPIRRVTVQPFVNEELSQNVSLLFERARTLESLASARESDAVVRARDAETLGSRARLLRVESQGLSSAERANLLAVAEDLDLRAASNRAQARELRLEAAEFRSQAATLRERAAQLARTGGRSGGWGRPRPLPRPVPVVASGTTL